MILSNSTNFLYLADTLPIKYQAFYKEFEKILVECNIDFGLLPGSRDVWAVDYMPVQVRTEHFVQFVYNPDYLQTKALRPTISDVDKICREIGIRTAKSGIVLDGGNIAASDNIVIMCDKVFRENRVMPENQLIKDLQNLFEVEDIFFVPQDPNDYTGHADGMVRFINNDTVLINDYSREAPEFQAAFRKSLHDTGLECVEIPYCPDITSNDSAKGLYLNYLQMENIVIIPTFGIPEDDKAVRQLEQIFKGCIIKTIDGNGLAVNGGILNCISWNIEKKTGN